MKIKKEGRTLPFLMQSYFGTSLSSGAGVCGAACVAGIICAVSGYIIRHILDAVANVVNDITYGISGIIYHISDRISVAVHCAVSADTVVAGQGTVSDSSVCAVIAGCTIVVAGRAFRGSSGTCVVTGACHIVRILIFLVPQAERTQT